MHDIICPHCSKAFKIDESGYADILRQVRDREFDKQLHERLEMAEREKQTALKLARSEAASQLQRAAAEKEAQIQALEAQLQASGKEISSWPWNKRATPPKKSATNWPASWRSSNRPRKPPRNWPKRGWQAHCSRPPPKARRKSRS